MKNPEEIEQKTLSPSTINEKVQAYIEPQMNHICNSPCTCSVWGQTSEIVLNNEHCHAVFPPFEVINVPTFADD